MYFFNQNLLLTAYIQMAGKKNVRVTGLSMDMLC